MKKKFIAILVFAGISIGTVISLNNSKSNLKLSDLTTNNYEALAQSTFIIYQCAYSVSAPSDNPYVEMVRDCWTCKRSLSGTTNQWWACDNRGPL
ncbi:MAG: hypothetical protein LIP06_05580 [Tannerellaceae bacterium]|nr:hypothetical protein [Tannerellaceae bacterium]